MVHVKKVEIFGFKSFGFRNTTVNFEPGLVSISGPNGSGKSNILDAIIFAMGENKPKVMRVDKLRSLIHDIEGSGRRGPKMARSSVHFDNTDRKIPVDSDVVEITRELDENGDNTYYLNKKKTQRSHVLDLLDMANAGLGQLNAVQQGTVTRISEFTSEEKRKTIEDLIGLSYFDEKKSESIKQLDEADRRLEIALAKMGEIKKRIDELEEERNQKLRHDILERELNRYKAISAANKMKTISLQKSEKEGKLHGLKEQIDNLDSERTVLRDEIGVLDSEKSTLMNAANDYTQAKATLDAEISSAMEQYEIDNTAISASNKRLEQINIRLPQIKIELEEIVNAREDIDLTVLVQRPEILVSPSKISLEIDGIVGNASQVKDGDTVVVLVDVQNIGNADADDVKVEIYYYPKKTPETTQEIDALVLQGFVFDEGENTYVYMLYSKDQNIKSNNEKTIASDDWLIQGGEWYVEVRADYDQDNDNGAILEPNENNNDGRYSELLRVKPDLAIDAMKVDSKYGGETAQTPNVDDIVTFTVTVTNSGAADVTGARLYITADSSADNEILKDRTNSEYVEFDVDAGETTDVRFRWKATLEDWTTFRAEINPVCNDYDISASECDNEGDGFASETGHMFDELGRYADNEFPRSGVFTQNDVEVRFEVLPDFIIKKVVMDPRSPEVGETVEVTVTIENQGNADWAVNTGNLEHIFEDGVGDAIRTPVGEPISRGDTVEIKFAWTVPDEDKDSITLVYTLNPGSGNFEIDQCVSGSKCGGSDNDEYEETFTLVLPAVLGEIEAINYLTERDLVKGVPLIIPVLILVGLAALSVPLVIYRRRGGPEPQAGPDDDDDGSEESEDDEAQVAAPPSKFGVAIVSQLDGKTANVKVPSNMPVNKLLQNCVDKFPLPHANFAVMLNGVPVDLNATLADAGLTDGCQVDLVSLE